MRNPNKNFGHVSFALAFASLAMTLVLFSSFVCDVLFDLRNFSNIIILMAIVLSPIIIITAVFGVINGIKQATKQPTGFSITGIVFSSISVFLLVFSISFYVFALIA